MLIKAKVCLRSGVLSEGGQMSSIAAKRRAKHTRTILVPRASCSLRRQAWARGLGGAGDTGFKVLDFRTSVHFWFSTTFLIAFTCSCRSVNDCKFRWFQSSNLLLNRKWPEVLKSRTSNPVPPVCPQSLLVLLLRPRRLKEQEALGTRTHSNESCLYLVLLAALTFICALDS